MPLYSSSSSESNPKQFETPSLLGGGGASAKIRIHNLIKFANVGNKLNLPIDEFDAGGGFDFFALTGEEDEEAGRATAPPPTWGKKQNLHVKTIDLFRGN